jgi:hypothetical protein
MMIEPIFASCMMRSASAIGVSSRQAIGGRWISERRLRFIDCCSVTVLEKCIVMSRRDSRSRLVR